MASPSSSESSAPDTAVALPVALPVAPVLDVDKARYLTERMDDVQGWLIPSTALYLAGLEVAQRGDVAGGICEIGVHRGKSFLAMTIDAPAGEDAVAIDVFDMQNLNEDGTSVKAKATFEGFLDDWKIRDRVEVVEGSSLELEQNGFLDGGRRFRLFSVDGGHGSQYVVNDLELAEKTLVEGGVVAADDVFNTHWLGVCTGFFEYMHGGGTLRPFALIPNKLLLTDAGNVEKYRELMRELFGAAMGKKDVPLLDGHIDAYSDIDWTIRDTAGTEARLLRPDNSLASVRASLTGVTLELARVNHELRRANSHNTSLRKKAAAAEAAAKKAKKPAQPATASQLAVALLRDNLPAGAKKPARKVYRTLRARRRGAKR